MKKVFALIVCLVTLLMCVSVPAAADTRNSADLVAISYSYDLLNKPYSIPAPFVYSSTISGDSLGIGTFKDLSDVFYCDETKITVLADSGNNRIVLLDENLGVKKVITSLQYNGTELTFKNPKSAIIKSGVLYIADSDNARIISTSVSDLQNAKMVYDRPTINALGADYIYSPHKLAVDDAGHIYVVAKDITDGIILLDTDGTFIAFFGAPKVKVSSWKQFTKRFMTKTQREKLYKSIPTEYNSISIDQTGFIVATTQSTDVTPLSRLNHMGENIFEKKLNSPAGDEVYSSLYSTFTDATEDEAGNFIALDNRKGRMFIYDNDGILLGVFGGTGTQNGTFNSAVAIDMIGEKIAVADTSRNTVQIFTPTAFWTDLKTGLELISAGDYQGAKPYFEDTVTRCAAYIPAHLNLGRIAFTAEDYETAMKEFRYVDNKEYYSLAYKKVRTDLINNNFAVVLIIAVVLIVLVIGYSVLIKIKPQYNLLSRYKDRDFYRKWKYVNYCSFHPFDGFWCVRREGQGSLAVANIIFGIFIVFYIIRTQFSAYLFKASLESDVLVSTLGVVIPLLLWVVVSWALSTFFDGKARMKDMYITMCYSLKPYLLASLILFPLTFILVQDEAFIYNILDSIVWIWMLGLMFLSMITVQDFSLSKGIVSALFTMVGIALVVFLGLIIVDIGQEIVNYFAELISEINYRTL